MNRRDSIVAALALLVSGGVASAFGQPMAKARRIGFLNPRNAANELDAAFRQELRRLGYIEGRTIEIDYRWGANSDRRAEVLATELVAGNVEVIVTATTLAVRAAKRATTSIPIVMAASADPVGAGLVASLARPGGNVTGLTLVSTDTAAKRLQLLRDVVPSAKRVAVLIERTETPEGDQVNRLLVDELQSAAKLLGLSLAVTRVRASAELPGAFEGFQSERADALLVQASRLMIDERSRVAALAASYRLPALYETEIFVEAGGFLSFGPSITDMYRRAAGYVDRILRGAKPAELPIELPLMYDLVINRRTAETLRLPVSRELLLRATRVVE